MRTYRLDNAIMESCKMLINAIKNRNDINKKSTNIIKINKNHINKNSRNNYFDPMTF